MTQFGDSREVSFCTQPRQAVVGELQEHAGVLAGSDVVDDHDAIPGGGLLA